MGIVTIPPGCMVQSKTGIIYGSTDKVATFKRRYAIMTTEVMDIPKDEAKQVPIELKHIVPIHDETDKVLQEAAQDLAALDTSTTWMWVAIALAASKAVMHLPKGFESVLKGCSPEGGDKEEAAGSLPPSLCPSLSGCLVDL